MKHICVFLAFQNVEHVKLSFDSMVCDGIDYFVVENWSENSEEIKNYFLTKNLKGYIQFKENIASNAVNIFIRDFGKLLENYDYITITDGDLYLANAKECFKEIVNNLEYPNAAVSSIKLFAENNYNLKNPVIGLDNFVQKHNQITKSPGPVVGRTANNLVTLKRENLDIIKNINYIDSFINRKIEKMGKLWVHTNRNLAYHLTWDLYRPGNPYFEWKKKVIGHIWTELKESSYQKII